MKTQQTLKLGQTLTLPTAIARERIAIFGQSGSGKTNLLYLLFEVMVRAGVQVGLIDPPGVGWGLAYDRAGRLNDLPVTIIGGPRADLPIVVGRARELADVVIDQQLSFVLDLTGFENDRIQATWLAEFIARIHRRKIAKPGLMHLMFDEAQDAAPSKPRTSEQSELGGVVERFCKQIRNYAVGWTVASQQPQAVDSRIRGQTSCVFGMRTQGELDIKAVIATVNRRTGGLSPKQLEHLTTGHALVYSPMFFGDEINEHVIGYRDTFDVPKAAEERTPMPAARQRLSAGELEKLKASYGEAVAEAERTDPVALQAKLDELRAENQQLRAQVVDAGEKMKSAKPQALPAGDLKALARDAAYLDGAVQKLDKLWQQIADVVKGPLEQSVLKVFIAAREQIPHTTAREISLRQNGLEVPKAWAPGTPYKVGDSIGPTGIVNVLEASSQAPAPVKAAGVDNQGSKMLLALARTNLPHLSRTQLCTLAGVSSTSSSTSTALGKLRLASLIADLGGGLIAITPEGRKAVGPVAKPQTHQELLAMWLRSDSLTPAAVKCLQLLAPLYPAGLKRAELLERAGLSLTSSSSSTGLGRLRGNGLVEDLPGGEIRAAACLYPERAA